MSSWTLFAKHSGQPGADHEPPMVFRPLPMRGKANGRKSDNIVTCPCPHLLFHCMARCKGAVAMQGGLVHVAGNELAPRTPPSCGRSTPSISSQQRPRSIHAAVCENATGAPNNVWLHLSLLLSARPPWVPLGQTLLWTPLPSCSIETDFEADPSHLQMNAIIIGALWP